MGNGGIKSAFVLYIGNKEKAYTAAHNVIDAKTNSGQIVIDLVRSKDFYSECILALSNNEIKDNIGGFSSSTSNFMTAANYGKLFSGKVTTDDFRAKDFGQKLCLMVHILIMNLLSINNPKTI